MATYTVKAPDGKTVTLQGPDGASQADIIAQAQKLYTPAAPAAPAATAAPAAPPAAAPNELLSRYNAIRNGLAAKVTDPKQQQYVLARFDADPRVQQLRKSAGLAPLSTRQVDVQQVARKSLAQRTSDDISQHGPNASQGQSFGSGFSIGAFGLPEMLAAAGLRFLPSSLTGNKSNLTYQQLLDLTRQVDKTRFAAHPAAGIAGALVSSALVSRGAGLASAAAAASRVPAIAKVGNVLQNLGTLRKGERLANAGKLVTIGAAAGGAQAAGTGEDIPTGAAEGALAAPVVAGGVKVAQVLTRPFRDVLRLSSAGQILSRLTTATLDQLKTKAASYRDATGAEPTLFELLPLADRNTILKQAVVGKDNVVEQASDAIRARAQNLGPEMSDRARQILQPQRDFIQNGLRTDIATARGGALAPGDEDMIANAMESPTDMLHLRDQEAQAIMAPHEATPVVANLEDLFPSVPGPGGTSMGTDPEVATVIRSAAGTLRTRASGAGVTAGDITDMISTLRGDLGKGGIEGRNAERAINHLQDVLDTKAPDAGAAAHQMTEAYAARSRMAEGMQEGHATRLRDDVQVGTSRRAARTVRNAYDTPEGAQGRALGQGNRALSDLGGSPEEALRATVKISRGSTGRQVGQNVGADEAGQLIDASRAQDESAQALASASAKAQSGSGQGADAETLVQAIAGLHPSSFITTKSSAVRKLLDMTYIPETRAKTMVDMLFSQNPALTQRAMKAIGNEPNGAKFIKYLVGAAGQLSAEGSAPDDSPPPAAEAPTDADGPADAGAEAPDEAQEAPPAEGEPADEPQSPYTPALLQIYQNENPDLIHLIQRVKQQESGGDQSKVSKKGAVGVMQVMPKTGPEAAQLAGVPWDPKAYKGDPAYNELIGIAYLSQLLRKYGGDVARALAAYNAGPDRADKAISTHGGNFLSAMPSETQDYVQKVGS